MQALRQLFNFFLPILGCHQVGFFKLLKLLGNFLIFYTVLCKQGFVYFFIYLLQMFYFCCHLQGGILEEYI